MPSISGACLDTSPLAVELAVRFVQRESEGLATALHASHDRPTVQEALRRHDDAHRAWLALLAGCHRAAWPCGATVDRLYTFHGRLAELLDRGWLPEGQIRTLLTDHLRELTDEAVAGLRAAGRLPALRTIASDASGEPARAEHT